MQNDCEYDEKIKIESTYWHKKTIHAFKNGCPPWVDRRRYLYQQYIKGNVWGLKIDDLIRGEEIKKIIEIAVVFGGKVLDLGAGSGWLSLELARQGLDVRGIDISGPQIKIGRHFARLPDDEKVAPVLLGFELKEKRGEITYQVGDLNFIELPEETYTTVVSWDTLHHISRLDELLFQVKKSLKLGGKLVICDHDYRNPVIDWIILKMRGRSPFEDISVGKIRTYIAKYFFIEEERHHLAFTHIVKRFLDLIGLKDTSLKFYLVNQIRRLDNFLVSLKLVKGEYIYILAHKK